MDLRQIESDARHAPHARDRTLAALALAAHRFVDVLERVARALTPAAVVSLDGNGVDCPDVEPKPHDPRGVPGCPYCPNAIFGRCVVHLAEDIAARMEARGRSALDPEVRSGPAQYQVNELALAPSGSPGGNSIEVGG